MRLTSHFRTLLVCLLTAFSICSNSWATQVTCYHYDTSSTGQDLTETTLTPANVNTTSFFKRFTTTVDGALYAQPLYMPSVTVVGGANAGIHNLAIVATQHDSLYAIDADSGAVVWQTSFLTAGALPGATAVTSVPSGDTGSSDTSPEIGICGTPVIDPSTKMIYLAAKTKQIISGNTTTPSYVYTVYKVDLTNGNATANSNIVSSSVVGVTTYNGTTFTYRTNNDPTAAQDPFVFGSGDGVITVNSKQRVYFNALREMNRPGLLLNGGTLYVPFGSHGDNGPYHGWMIGFDKNTLAITSVFNATPNGGEGGFWAGGAAPSIDANGFIYFMTGNGSFDGFNNGGATAGLDSLGFPVNGDYGMSFIKLATDTTTTVGNQNKNGWGLKVVDYFTPFNTAQLNSADTDLGSSGICLLPDSSGSVAHPHLMVAAGKQGNIYLVDRDNLGKFNATTDNVVQSQVSIGSCFGTFASFNGWVYIASVSDFAKAFTVTNGVMSTGFARTPDTFSWPGCTPTVSGNGTSNAIIWMIDRSTLQLRAYPFSNFTTELWNSAQAANNRDALPSVAKFATPTVADGHVMVGTQNSLVVYGTSGAATSAPAAPTKLSATAISSLEIDLSWTDNASNETGFAIEQSSDGTTFTQIATVGVNSASYQVTNNLQAGLTYYFRVRAYNNFNTQSFSAYTNVASATTPTTQASSLNFSGGFTGSNSTLKYNSFGKIVNGRAELTDGGANESSSVFSIAPQNIQRFSTTFTWQDGIHTAYADGFTFTIQGQSASVVGGGSAGLGYAGITPSLCIKFDIYNNAGEGFNSTGLFTGGAAPTSVNSKDMTGTGVVIGSGDVMSCTLSYDGTILSQKVTDTVTGATVSFAYTVNIPGIIGGNSAYVGFTGASGGLTSTQDILSWIYSPLATAVPAAATNLAATALSGTQVTLTWTDNATNESGYLIMRKTGATGTYAQVGVAAAGATTFSDSGLAPNTTYLYTVYATNAVGNSLPSNEVSILTPIPPVTPTNAQPTNITTTSIAMSWTDNANNETGYNVLRKQTTAANFALVQTLPPNTTTYTDTNLLPGTSYDYHIQAFNSAGYSDFSGFTAVTLGNTGPPVVSMSTPGAVAVNGITNGSVTFSCGTATSSALAVNYTVSGTAVAGADYTALSGTATIAPNASSVSVPIAALGGATSNSTVTLTLGSSANYTAGTPSSATVVLENSTYSATAQNQFASANVSGTTGGTVTLPFTGLPGSPAGAVYVWYNASGNAFATTTVPSYSITNAIPSQSGTYSVYAWAPGGVTGSQSFVVTITDPVISIVPSVNTLSVNDGASNSFTVSLSSAPVANVTVNVSISGTPAMTVTPATITMTPANYQNQTVAVAASPINSNDSNRSATVTLSAASAASATVAVSDVASDTQVAANLSGTSAALVGSNIGGGAGASSVRASGLWWVDGSGTSGLASASDSFHFESVAQTGDFSMVVQVQDIVGYSATAPLAGLMIRDGTATGSNFLALACTDANTGSYQLISRTTVNAAPTQTATTPTYLEPNAWLKLTSTSGVLHAFVSSDGVTYTEVTNSSTGVTWSGISSSLNIGLFSSSSSAANTRAVFSNFSISSGTALAVNFAGANISNPPLAGSATLVGGVYTIKGNGFDIWSADDELYFDNQTVTTDQTLICHVDSVSNADVWSKAGLMFRTNTTGGSPFVGVFVNPGNPVEIQWRDAQNGQAAGGNQITSSTATKWLKLVKAGLVYSAYYATTSSAPTSNDWILVATHTATTPVSTYLAGLAVCSHNTGLYCTAVFSNVSFGQLTSTTPPPVGYSDADVGTPHFSGSANLVGSQITMTGSGFDIWNSLDEFNYYYQTNTTDKTIIAHVDSLTNTDVWSKAGVMFRDSSAAGAECVGLYANPNKQVEIQWRDATNVASNGGSQVGNTTNAKWLKLVKTGNVFTAYYATTTATPASTDWVLVGTHSTTFTGATYLGGLCVCSHNDNLVATAVFSGLSQQ